MNQVQPLPSPTGQIRKSDKLADVCYDIRGPVLTAANQLEAEGHQILKLNIGNPAPWGLVRRKKFCVTWYATFQIPKAIVTPRACSPHAKR